MRSTIFSALVWAASSAVIRFDSGALSNSAHMVRTVRGWAIAAIVISLARQFLRWKDRGTCEVASRQVLSAFAAFILLVIVMTGLTAVPVADPIDAAVLAFFGGVVAPVMTIIALEFPALRPRAFGAGLVAVACLGSFAFVNALLIRPASKPGVIRTNQPAEHHEKLRSETASVA